MTDHHAPSTPARQPATQGDRIAAVVMWIEVAVVVGWLVFYAYETATGQSKDVVRAVMSMVTIALLGVFVALVARGLGRGAAGARVPAVVWNVMLLPVGIDLVRSGEWGWGLPLLALAVTAIVGAVLGMRSQPRD